MNRKMLGAVLLSLALPLTAMAQSPSTDSAAPAETGMQKTDSAAKPESQKPAKATKKGSKKSKKAASPRKAKAVRSSSVAPSTNSNSSSK